METRELIAALSRPQAWPDPPKRVEVLQTHISTLFFVGERVYKVKKPVDMGFLDYSTLPLRERYCREEVRLNRRMTQRVHLGVVPIVRAPDGGLRVGGAGEPVEWAVEMVRLDPRRMLDALLAAGEVDNAKMDALAALLADFHARAATGPGVDEHARPAAVRALVLGNLDELERFVVAEGGLGLSARGRRFLRRRAAAFLDEQERLLARRVAEGRARDGHGDLHAGNICFGEAGIDVYDCIEFSAAFRCADVACDLAFLAMDLDFRGFPAFGGYLVRRYAELARDAELGELLAFYKGYRACVRGKVAALTAEDPDLGEERRDEMRAESARYLQLALAYELPPALVLTCGLPASGKSHLARHLAAPLDAALLSSDVRRKVLAGLPPEARAGADYGAGLYSAARKDQTYASLLAKAREALARGRSAVVDATFSSARRRAPFLELARELGAPAFVAHVRVEEPVALARLRERAERGGGPSDADEAVYRRMSADFEPPEELAPPLRIELCGDAPPLVSVGRALDAMVAAVEARAELR